MREIVDFYALTEWRRGEGLGIDKKRDIDLGNRILHIGQPKRHNYRVISISDDVAVVIRRLVKRSAGSNRLVALTGPAIYNRFRRPLAKADIGRNVRVHSLRHTFSTWLAAKGAAPRKLQELRGHSSMATTAKYVHPVSEAIKMDMERLKLQKANR